MRTKDDEKEEDVLKPKAYERLDKPEADGILGRKWINRSFEWELREREFSGY